MEDLLIEENLKFTSNNYDFIIKYTASSFSILHTDDYKQYVIKIASKLTDNKEETKHITNLIKKIKYLNIRENKNNWGCWWGIISASPCIDIDIDKAVGAYTEIRSE